MRKFPRYSQATCYSNCDEYFFKDNDINPTFLLLVISLKKDLFDSDNMLRDMIRSFSSYFLSFLCFKLSLYDAGASSEIVIVFLMS